MRVVERLDAVSAALEQELRRPAADRETGACDEGLQRAVVDIARARALWTAGDEAGALVVLDEVGRAVGDSWSYRSSLAVDVLDLGQRLRRSDQP